VVCTTRVSWRVLACALVASLMLASSATARHKEDGNTKIKGHLVDISISEDGMRIPATIKHGWTTFRIINDGAVPHSIQAKGKKNAWSLASNLQPGQTILVPINLKKGVYTIWEPTAEGVAPLQTTITVH
jgi:hypothetical protein